MTGNNNSQSTEENYSTQLSKVPDVNVLKTRFRLIYYFQMLLFVLITAADISFFHFLYLQSDLNSSLAFRVVIPAIVFIFLLFLAYGFLFIKRVHILDYTKEKIGHFDTDEILKILKELFLPLKRDEKPNFYVVPTNKSIALSVDLFGLNFIKPLNAIYISSLYFNILNPDEMKALIGHEIAHFKEYTNPLQRGYYSVMIFISLYPMVAFHWYNFSGSIWSYALLSIIYLITMAVLTNITAVSSKSKEFLSDYYGGEKYGKLNMINALITILRLQENISYLYVKVASRIKKSSNLSFFSHYGIVELIEKRIPDRIVSRKELNRYINEVFNSEEVEAMKEEQTEDKIANRNEKIDKFILKISGLKKNKIIDWDSFDINIKDYKVDKIEYPYLIDALLKNPKKQLFRLKFDNHLSTEVMTHPTMRERILFLHKNIKKIN